MLKTFQEHQKAVNLGKATWDDYFKSLKDNEKWQVNFIQNTDLQKASTEDLIKASQTARDSALEYNDALKAQTLSAQAGQIALKAFANAGTMVAEILVAKGIEFIATAIDDYIHQTEKANEAMQDAFSQHESAKSNLDHITSALNEQKQKMDELLSKDKLTYAEKGQLKNLKDITKELSIQQDIEQRQAERTSKEAADKAVIAYQKQYSKYDFSRENVNEKLEHAKAFEMTPIAHGEDDIAGNIAAFLSAKESYEKSKKEYEDAAKNGKDTQWLSDTLSSYEKITIEKSEMLDNTIDDLSNKRFILSDEYNKVTEKLNSGDTLSPPDQAIVDTYQSICDSLKLIYEFTDPDQWNKMEISDIFYTENIEKTKDELTAMSTAGKLTPESIENYPNLNQAVQNSELFLKKGQTAAEAFCEEISRCAEAAGQLSDADSPFPDTFSDPTEKISKITSAYETFTAQLSKTESPVLDPSTIEEMRDTLVEMNGETPQFGVTEEQFNEFENIVTSGTAGAEQIQKAFNALYTQYINASGILNELSASNHDMIVKRLELKGVTNASAIATSELAQGLDDVRNAGFDLNTVLNGDVEALNSIPFSSQEASNAFAQYMLAKLTANGVTLDTDTDINNLLALMDYLGDSTDALTRYASMKGSQETGPKSGNKTKKPSGSYNDRLKEQAIKEVKAAKEKHAPKNTNTTKNSLPRKSGASNSSASKAVKEETDHMSALNSELEKYRSKLKAVQEARETYNQYGKITVDQAKNILDADFKLLAAYENEEAALENLGQAKLNEMQIQLARNAVDTINQITSEAQATEYLAGVNEHLAGSSLSATEAMLQQAVAAAKLRGTMQGQAADTILKGYQNGAMMLSQVDFGFQIPQSTGTADTKPKENVQKETEKTFSKEFNWIEKLINQLNKTTEKLKDSADRFISWWRKNKALDQAIKAARKEIAGNQDAYYYYIRKADKTGLNKKYKRLIQEGTIRIQDIKDEGLADKIEKYQDWWDKAQDCKDAVMELYDVEREMTNQKYDNMLEFYDSLDSKVQSVIDKIEILMGLKEARGKQLDINDLLEEFNSYDTVGQLQITDMTPGNAKPDGSETIEVGNSGIETEGMHTKAADPSIQDAVTDGVKETAVYKGLLANIEKLEKKRAKKGKLSKKEEETLASYYSKKSALEENATADTAAQYSTTYDAYMKLQTKLDSGKSLTREQRMKYDQYKASLNQFSQQRQDQIDDLQNALDNSSEKITDPTESYEKRKNEVKNSYEKQIADAESDVRNTKQYKEIKADIENLESKSKRTKSQEQKLQQRRLELEALESGGTSANISEYLKAFRRLTELSGKKKLSAKQQIEYDTLASQLRQWNKEKQDALGQLRSEMDDTIENLNTEQEKAANDSTAKIAENQKKAYETAKRIAEIGATTLESELNLLDSCMAGIEKRLTLYQKFGVDTLKKLGYIEGDMNASQSELIMQEFRNYLDSFNEKKTKLTNQRDIYRKLIDSVNAHDYSSIKEMYSNGIFAEYGDTFDKVIALLKDNTFDGYSQEWVKEWEQAFSAIEQEIDDLNMSTQDLLDTMREEVTFRSINEAVTQLGYLKDQLSSMSGLFQDDFLYAQNGALTDYGVKKAAVIIKQLENAQKLALEYREKYNRALSDDTFAGDKEKQDYLNNLKNQYSQELGEVKSFTEQLVSLYQNQKNSEINSLKEVIAKRKEALQAKKDYYNWDKNLKEKNKDIDALKAQIAATESINTAESKAKLASLRAELEDKETELNELKEDHLYSMQTEALDQFSNWLSEDTEARTKSLEYQREIIEQLSQITEGYDIADIIDSLEQYYLDQGYNALRDQTFTPSDINLQSGITESMIPAVHIPEFNYEGSMPAQANIDIHYDSMLKVEGNVDSYVVNDLKQHMETQYNYTKSRLTADLGKVGVMNR